MKQISQKYYSLYPDKLKHFYIEFKPDIDQDVVEIGDHIYIKGEELGIHNIYEKCVKAIEYVNHNYEYEFMLRTNISSFMHLPNIFDFLETMPTHSFGGGFADPSSPAYPYPWIAGTGIFMSKDVAQIIANDKRYDHPNARWDDVFITQVMIENGINITNVVKELFLDRHDNDSSRKYSCLSLITGHYIEDFAFDPKHTLYFRVRNDDNREDVDIKYQLYLLKLIYGILI